MAEVNDNSAIQLFEDQKIRTAWDARAAEEWLSNVARVLEGRSPDYLVVTHMEPDHSGSLMRLAQKYPEMKIVGNAKTFTMIKQFFGTGALSEDRMLEVGEGSTISLGSHHQQRGRQNGHGGVLRARDRDSAFQPLPALYDVFYQIKSPLRFYWKHRMQSGGFAVSAGSTGMICGFAPKSVFAEARRSAVAMQTSTASSGHLLRIPHRHVKVKKK